MEIINLFVIITITKNLRNLTIVLIPIQIDWSINMISLVTDFNSHKPPKTNKQTKTLDSAFLLLPSSPFLLNISNFLLNIKKSSLSFHYRVLMDIYPRIY